MGKSENETERRDPLADIVAGMRDALEAALRFLGNLEIDPYSPLDEDASELRQRIMDALSAPPRQCDVGTAEEQYERYLAHCRRTPHCTGCEAFTNYLERCEFAWAQTPYAAQEGVGK